MTSTRLVAPSSAVKISGAYEIEKEKATNDAMSTLMVEAWKDPSSPANKKVRKLNKFYIPKVNFNFLVKYSPINKCDLRKFYKS